MMTADPYSDPGVFEAALQWLQATLLGPLATSFAVIAIAVVGLRLMSARIHSRRAVEVALGCFIIFGASTIADGIVHSLSERPANEPDVPSQLSAYQASPEASARAVPYDPYAGASVPPR